MHVLCLQELAFPSPDAYARLWVDDHLLYPHNTTVKGWGDGFDPKWIPLPPRALDGNGTTVEVPRVRELGSYKIRLEYVCMALSQGCPQNQTITIRWASFDMFGDGGVAPFVPIAPPTVLVPVQSEPEVVRRQLRSSLESGWGTFDHSSSLTWVLLPGGCLHTFRVLLGDSDSTEVCVCVCVCVWRGVGGTLMTVIFKIIKKFLLVLIMILLKWVPINHTKLHHTILHPTPPNHPTPPHSLCIC